MALTLRTAVGRTTPLTNIELDANFTYLETQSNLRLVITDYNYSTILDRLNGAPAGSRGYGSNLDVRYLQGSEPNSVLPSTSNKQSVVLRDSTGNFTANIITANLTGKSTTSGTADQSIKLQTARNINTVAFDGTADITIYDKTKLPVNTVVSAGSFVVGVTYLILTLGTTDWVSIGVPASPAPAVGTIFVANGPGTGSGTANVVMISKLITKASTTTNANFNIPAGAAPSEPINGDIWSSTTTGTLFTRTNSVTRQFAYLDSTITGNAANVTGIVAIAHGGTGKNNIADARVALDVAKRGDNSDITSITGLTTALSTGQGGTGLLASGADRNILISNGTVWASEKPSGTWDISISGEAATAVKSVVSDTAEITTTPATFTTAGVVFELKKNAKETLDDGGTYFGEMSFRKAGSAGDFTKGKSYQLGFTDNTNLHIRSGTSSTWGDWYKFLNSNNYNDYAPKKDGTGASGSWGISITGSANSASSAGSADSATKLTTARTINGVSFNGTANITIADSTKLSLDGGTLTGKLGVQHGADKGIHFPANPYGGSGDYAKITYESISPDADLPEKERTRLRFTVTNDTSSSPLVADAAEFIVPDDNSLLVNNNIVLNAANYNNYAPKKDGTGASGTWSIDVNGSSASTSGNAATATKLATPIKINGVSFDGSTDITVGGNGALSTAGGTMSGDITIYKVNPTLFLNDTGTGTGTGAFGTELAIGVQGENFIIYEPDDGNREWFKITDASFTNDESAYVYGKKVLDSGNYTSYVASNTGTGASGTWDISISGNADTATTSGNAATATKLATARKINGVLFDGTKDISISIPTSATASDVYAWAKEENKPSYSYSEITGTKPSYAYSDLTGTAPTFNQNTTGKSGDSTKWNGSTKFVQSTTPTSSVDGDIWFKV